MLEIDFPFYLFILNDCEINYFQSIIIHVKKNLVFKFRILHDSK